MDGRSPEEAANIDLYFIDAIGLGENLSPTRSNGLRAMIAQMKLDALVFSQKNE
jgi:cysteine desulfuration protein SufE